MHQGIRSWKDLVIYAFNAFSTPLLFKTLFSPWERSQAEREHFTILERIVFSIVIRILGFIARTFFIILGLLFTLLVIISFPIFLFTPINIKRENMQHWRSFGAFLSYGKTYTLDKHSQNLLGTKKMRAYGKDKALRLIERGLSKDTNHNVLLVGEAGVGKSLITEYLGHLGNSALSFPGIKNHRVVQLNTEGLSLEDFDTSMKEAKEAGNVIVVIENIHKYESLFERLAHYLNTDDLGVIATTDFGSFDQVLKAHPEFLTKFEKVDVEPTNGADTLAILKDTAKFHDTKIKEDALAEIVNLSDKLIHNQPKPQKALLVLEELRSLNKKITVEDVRQIVSDKTNMPVGVIGADETKVLLDLEKSMRSKIVGQDEAVEDVTEALKRLRTGIADPHKPAGTFLFLGPTGVGKTYTAKILAESYFGSENAMVRFDMSEFSQEESLGLFSERLASVIEDNPLSLVFFDELEKSHRAVQHLLLQVLDEGRLTRENGRVATFTESIIIATSNAGSMRIIENTSIDKKTLIDSLIEEGTFAPEFLNRFSGIILFKPLTKLQARRVTELMLSEFAERLYEDKQIKLVLSDALIDKVAAAGFDPEFGARPIKRAIEEIVENQVAEHILSGKTVPGGELKIV